jgi:hypothetical protein
MTTPNLSEPVGSTLRELVAEWRAELAGFARERFARPMSEGAQHIAIGVGESEIGAYRPARGCGPARGRGASAEA